LVIEVELAFFVRVRKINCEEYQAIIRNLLITMFLITVAGNSAAAVSPHLDGDGGCSADCCQAARLPGKQAAMSRLCCLMDCKQPGGTHNSSSFNPLGFEKQRPVALSLVLVAQTAFRLSVNVNEARTAIQSQSNDVYLKTGALLI
jgi:hypothetical protein